jgi:hypothetical protein
MEAEIIQKLTDKGLSEKSIKLYISILKNLNDKREIVNFKYLENPKKVLDKIKDYKLTTQRNVIIAIVSVLKNLGNDLYKKYYDLMIDMNKKIEETLKENKKSETQKENWIEWDDVVKKFEELKSKNKYPKNISETCYDNLLDTVILGLYVLVPPRRSKDYLMMKVSKDGKGLDKNNIDNNNFLDMKKKQFVFNSFKTNKTYGKQIVDIPVDLVILLKKYLKFKKEGNNFLLVKFNGENLKSDNAITRRLNKIFDKKIASSMLRHIYLSSKYGKVNEEMKADANAMSHSVEVQKTYIKK